MGAAIAQSTPARAQSKRTQAMGAARAQSTRAQAQRWLGAALACILLPGIESQRGWILAATTATNCISACASTGTSCNSAAMDTVTSQAAIDAVATLLGLS
ncbi:hypothetical protein T492DRAFT_891391, partial [Pavlovales sp. CCMP2436]